MTSNFDRRDTDFLPDVYNASVDASLNAPLYGKTQYFDLNLTNFDWVTWHNYEWENWRVVDALLNTAIGYLNIRGVWQPNTAYKLGEGVIDPDNLIDTYIALDDHTSSASWTTDKPLHWNIRTEPSIAVMSVFGRTGDIVAEADDYAAFYPSLTQFDAHVLDMDNPHQVAYDQLLNVPSTFAPPLVYRRTYETVADMAADAELSTGDIVNTLGYFARGDGGGNAYRIVSAGTGTRDDGAYLWLPGPSRQAEALFPHGIMCDRQWGASNTQSAADNRDALAKFLDYVARRTLDDANNIAATVYGGYEIDDTVTIPNGAAYGEALTIYFEGKLTASDTFTMNAPMIIADMNHCILMHPHLECSNRAAGIDIDGGSIAIFSPRIEHVEDFGILVDGRFGDCNIYWPTISQYGRGDADAAVDAKFTAHGVRFARADCNLFGGNTFRLGVCLYFTQDANTIYVRDHHPFNGRPQGDAGGPRVDPKLIVLEAGGNAKLYNCYLDNGQIEMHSPNLRIDGCQYLINTDAVTFSDKYVIGIYANGQAQPYQTFVRDLIAGSAVSMNGDGYALVKFMDDGTNTWAGDYSVINDELADVANTSVSICGDEYNVQTSATAPYATVWSKASGAMLHKLRTGTFAYEYGLTGTGDAFRIRSLNGTSDTALWIGSGTNGFKMNAVGLLSVYTGNQPRWEFVNNGVLRPVTDASQNLGSGSQRLDTVYAANGVATTSDARMKTDVRPIPDVWLDAWGTINYVVYRWINDDTCQHVGVIAQEIVQAFTDAGINVYEIGIIECDEDTGMLSVRHHELMMLESAYMRRELMRLRNE